MQTQPWQPTHLSLTEWLERIGYRDTIAFREEDNAKRYRLQDLQSITGLPTDKLWRFTAQEVADRIPPFIEATQTVGEGRCALRLVPLNPEHPKLRVWSVPVTEALAWFDQQTINLADYRAEFMPRPSAHTWSSIFIVNNHGIFGELIADSHDRLTQGFASETRSIAFAYDYATWQMSEANDAALAHVKELAAALCINDADVRAQLAKKLNATFAHNYLRGYFETVCSPEFGTWFIDYNRILGEMYADVHPSLHNSSEHLHGQTGSPGTSTGRARVLRAADCAGATIPAGDVLVMDMTTPECLPLMQRASAIVTEQGGILSHAAITCREMKKPCVIGVRNIFDAIKDGELIRVDANAGTITPL